MQFVKRDHANSGLVLLLCLLLAACDKNEEPSTEEENLSCELECVQSHGPDVETCHDDANSCLSACSAPDDEMCSDTCLRTENDCKRDLRLCGASCPCYAEFSECGLSCMDQPCRDACTMTYDECAQDGAPYVCVLDCDDTRFTCTSQCFSSSTSTEELLSCRATCDTAYSSCAQVCNDG